MANSNNPNVIWSRYVYLEPQYLQQSVDELSNLIKFYLIIKFPDKLVSCISEEEEAKYDFSRSEIKNISIISGIPVLKCHYLIYNFRYIKKLHKFKYI
jgi:hypothetical protein